ncbi:MAG: hypothetical protein A2849_01165 [Candidatus Taylorbacteria bacterium RIFCSPHIGHO2_01_FULL_51_15]|uniref:Uncharacterized protein n=1 Tax=Candidatus Taylorbacteria bacterium RIFCSPHIGHO2_01_FULL_51_15 TaxID=1802304 RepID=A0A1G2MB43_9BACT|nr:MAG: hypothetical protein A2849_01165 [Candidatus Taylorbacteria bacterium RIFCSPHIGHO2_01_FULL_51_15]
MIAPTPSSALVTKVLRELPPFETEQEGQIYTALIAERLLRAWPQNLSKDDLEFLNILCRKIEVTKKLLLSYELQWKQPKIPVALPPSFFPLILSVLLFLPAFPGGDKGQALKQLSAAFTLIDRAGDGGGVSVLDELRRYAEERLTLLTKD